MTFDARMRLDIASMFNAVNAREGVLYTETVTIEDEAGAQTQAPALQYDPYDPTSASKSQRRTFRFIDTVTVNRNYKIIQTTNNETATWWVKDVRDDREGTVYCKCERAIAKG